MEQLTFEHFDRPWTVNGERKLSRYERAALVKEWREAFAWLGLGQPHRDVGPVSVHVVPTSRNRRSRQDVAGCLPAAKAAIDGLVDAGVIRDDTPDTVQAVTFYPQSLSDDGPSLRVVLYPI